MMIRSTTRLFVIAGAASALATLGILACATDSDGDTSTPPINQPVPQPSADATPDVVQDAGARADAECVDAGGCIATTDCSTVHFCAAPFPGGARSIALNAIWGSSKNDVWAVGTRGSIFHSADGATWTSVPSNTTQIFFAVWGTSATDVWFLSGAEPMRTRGFKADAAAALEIVQGSSWNPDQASTGRLWTGRSFGPNEVWIAGEATARFADSFGNARSFWRLGKDEDDGGALWQKGEACSESQPCAPLVRSIFGTTAANMWAVGMKGQAFVLDDPDAGHWSYKNPNTTNDLEAVWGTKNDDVWAVGAKGTIRHFVNNEWQTVVSPTNVDLSAIWGSGANDIWAVGNGTVIHYDGSSWSLATIGLPPGDVPTRLLGVWGSGPDDVWIVGDGLVLHRTATSRKVSAQ